MKLALLSLITTNQFSSLEQEDPFNHLVTFYKLCGTLGTNSDDEDVVYLRLFPFSLIGNAKTWLQSHPIQSLTNWEDVGKKFVEGLFPPSKYINAKVAITTFSQGAIVSTFLKHGKDMRHY